MQEIRQNLWPDLCTTSILKYLVCCTQSALIHIRRKPVHPRAKNLAGCEGLQLMCVISSPAELPKAGITRELQHLLSKTNWWRGWLWSIWVYVCLCIYRKIFLNQAELRWYQRCSKALWMWKIWPQLYHMTTTNICTALRWGNVFIFYQQEPVNIHGVVGLSSASSGGCRGGLFW